MYDKIELYSKLKFNEGKFITINYYDNNELITKQVKLIKVVGVRHIKVIDEENKATFISFFSFDTCIKSIISENDSKPIYDNKYITDNMFNNCTNNQEKAKLLNEIEEKTFIDNKEFFGFSRANEQIERFFSRDHDWDYEDLFFSQKEQEEFEEFFLELRKDITRYCKEKGLNPELKFIGQGVESIVYKMGDKIIKIGKPRENAPLPYCEYILQPIINRVYYFDGFPINIEVTNEVEQSEYSYDQLYNFTKTFQSKLEEIGLFSGDLHPRNIGILKSDNKINFDSIYFDYADDETTQILDNNNLTVQKKESIILLDLNDLYIDNIDKYCGYLENIGFSKKQIQKVRKSYNEEHAIKKY